MISSNISGKGSGGRDDDAGLWDMVTKDIKPLRDKNSVQRPVAALPMKKQMPKRVVPAPLLPPLPDRHPGDQEVDRRTAEKLKKGRFPVDVTLDLHGMTQAAAHKRLLETLQSAYARRQRCVLVITGKGKSGAGIIRRSVPEWLCAPSLRAIVLRTESAQPADGGGGALYVLLRRQRTSTTDE